VVDTAGYTATSAVVQHDVARGQAEILSLVMVTRGCKNAFAKGPSIGVGRRCYNDDDTMVPAAAYGVFCADPSMMRWANPTYLV